MTFTVIAREERTGHLGIALCTSPIAVGSRCPYIKTNVGAVSTQAYTDPGLGPLAINLLNLGYTPEKVLLELASSDTEYTYRQIGVVDHYGRSAVHTGEKVISPKGSVIGTNYLVMGNSLQNDDVVDEMNRSWLESEGEIFELRLFRSLKAGRDAGGDAGGHRSASITTYDTDSYPRTDLRIDFVPKSNNGGDAVDALEVLLKKWLPMIPYYKMRAHDPSLPGWKEWLIDQGTPFTE